MCKQKTITLEGERCCEKVHEGVCTQEKTATEEQSLSGKLVELAEHAQEVLKDKAERLCGDIKADEVCYCSKVRMCINSFEVPSVDSTSAPKNITDVSWHCAYVERCLFLCSCHQLK